MSHNTLDVDASPEDVWALFSDGWSYATWVVGAARIRQVDEGWPAPGTLIHHSVGMWPLLINDVTKVLSSDGHRELVLEVNAWPGGRGTVTLRCEPLGPGRTRVVMEEQATHGPASYIPGPVEDAMLHWRNSETLRRLSYLVRSRAGSR
jgi:uncharacterized protein YndB with AHSA1/START domain